MQQRGSQITMEDETEDRTSCTSSTRGRQSNPKLKVLVRSHAMREETSPPREPSPNTTTSSHHHVNLSPCIKVIPSTENFPVDLTTTISPSSPNALLRLSPTLSRQSTPCSRSPVCVSPTSTLVPSSPSNSRCSPVQNLQNFSLSPNYSSSTQLYGCGQQVQQQACCSGEHDEERSAEECESFSSTASPKYNTGSNRHSSEKDSAAKQRDYNATTQAASHNTISHNNINNKKKLVCDCPSTATSTNQQSQQQHQSQQQTVAVAPSVCIKCAKNQLQQEQRNMNNNNLTNVANNNNNNNNNINNNNSVATSVGSSNSTNTNSNTLTVSRISSSHHHVHHNRGKLRQQSSSQGSFEGSSTGNSPCLSRDSSSELQYYTDTSGTDLEIFIPDTLNRNAKDRAFMLRIEQELVNLAKDKIKTHFKFPPMSSYQRMLVHRCAAYFGMEHNLESSGKCVVVNKTKNTRIPDIEFKEHVKEDIIFSNISDEQPRRSILKRDSNSCEEYGHHFKSPDRQYGGGSFESNRRSKSFEEREEAYEKVRRRIFNREMHDSNSNEDFEWAELPWSSTESDNPRFRLQLPEHNRRHAGKLIKVLSEETGETHRPCVAKSYSFGGYAGVLNRGDSIVSTHSAGPRLLTKQDSGASSVSWRLSPSSSGYKSQSQMSQMSESVTPSPTSTPHPPGDCGTTVLTPDGGGGGGGRQDSSSSETSGGRLEKQHSLSESSSTSSAVVWAITDLQNVPKGCPIINPQTGETIKNDDGTLYLYDPGNPPREFVSILSKPPPSPKRNPASSPQQKSSSASCSSSTTSITTATSTSTRETNNNNNNNNNNTNTNSNTTRSQSPRKHVQRSSKYSSSSSPAHHNNSSASSHSYSSAHHYNSSLSGRGNPNHNAKSYHVTNSSTSPSLPYSPPVMSAHHHHHHQNQRNSCFQFISNMNEVMQQQQQFASATMYNPAYPPPPPPHETLPPQPVYQHAPCILYAAAPYGLPVSPHYEGRMEQIPEIGGTYYMTIPESASAAAVPPVQSMTYHQQAAPTPSPYWNQQPTIAYYHPPGASSATPPQRYPVQAQTGYLPAATSYSQTYLPQQPGSQQQPPVLPPGNDLVPVYPHPHHHQQQQVQLVYSTTTPQPNQAAPSAAQMMYHPGGAATNQNAAGGASVLFTASTPQGPSSSSSGAMYPSSHQQMMYPPQQPQPLLSQQPPPPPPPQGGCLPPYPPNTPTPNSCTSSVSQSASSTSAFAGHLEGTSMMHHQQQQQQQQQHQMVMQQVAQNMAQMTFVQQHGHQSGVVPAGAMVQGAPPSSLLQHHQQQAFPLPPGPGAAAAVAPPTMVGGVANNKIIPSGAAPPYVDCISSGNGASSSRPNKKKFGGGGPPKQFTMMSSNHSQSSTGTSSPSAASTVVPVVAGATGGYPVSVAMPPQQQQQQAQQQPMMMTYHSSSNRTPSETPPNNNGASGQQFGGYSPAGCPPIPSMFFRQMSNIRASTPCTNKSSRSPTPASDISHFDKPRLPLPSTIYHGMPYVIQSSDSRIVSGRGHPNPYRHSAPVRQQSFSQSGDNRSHKNRKPKGSKPSSGQPSNNNGGKPL